MSRQETILVFGATGQQGGSVARAAREQGWQVRALVRDPDAPAARALGEQGIALVRGDLADPDSMFAAMQGVHGVFSVQPASTQRQYGMRDEDEVRYGMTVAALALKAGVRHLVYSSSAVVGEVPTGMGHFDSKACIEEYIRRLPLVATVVRPATFMELLVMPGFGLETGTFHFFTRPGQGFQVLAVRDIGRFVAAIFADPQRFGGATVELASDTVSGEDLAAAFSDAGGRPIAYAQFTPAQRNANPFLADLTTLAEAGRLDGKADLHGLRALNPDMLSFKDWLGTAGLAAFQAALGANDAWAYGRA